jgi:hypothetical protein
VFTVGGGKSENSQFFSFVFQRFHFFSRSSFFALSPCFFWLRAVFSGFALMSAKAQKKHQRPPLPLGSHVG